MVILGAGCLEHCLTDNSLWWLLGCQCFPYGSSVASVPASDAAEAPAGAATAAPLGGKSDILHLV